MLGGALIGGLTSMLGSWSNNLFNTTQASTNREFQSSEAEKQRKWAAAEAEQARAWNEEMYAKYNSLQGKVAQAEQAGVNPLFAVTGNSVTPMNASSSVSSGAAATGGSLASASPFDLAEAVLSGSKLKAEIDLLKAQKDNLNKESSWIDSINEMNIKEMQSNIEKNSAEVSSILQDIKESISRVNVNDSLIKLNGANLELVGSETILNHTKNIVEHLKAQELSILMPYVEARQQAAISLSNAQSDEARSSAERQMYDANVSMLKGLVEARLIDSDYYDSLISNAKWESANNKREYKWKPINDICSNISKIAVGVGSVLSGFGSVGGSVVSPSSVTSPAILSFF